MISLEARCLGKEDTTMITQRDQTDDIDNFIYKGMAQMSVSAIRL